MKKRLTLALVLVMITSVCFAGGCTKNTASLSSSGASNTASLSSSVADLAPAALKVWLVGTGKQKDSDIVWKNFNETLKKYLPSTTADFTAFTFDEYATKWSTAMAAGEVVDLAWFGWVQDYKKEVSMGSLTPLNKLVDTYCADAVNEFGKKQLDLYRYTDKELYVFPCWQGMVEVEPYISFQKDTVDLMGAGWLKNLENMMLNTSTSKDVKTKTAVFDELTKYYEACKKANMLRGGAQPTTLGQYSLAGSYRIGFGGDVGGAIAVGDDTFKLVPYYTNELAKLNWSYTAKWFSEGYIRADVASVKSLTTFIPKDQKNSTLTYLGGTYTAEGKRGDWLTSVNGFDIVSAKVFNFDWINANTATCWCIPRTTKNPERAAMLLNLLNSKKGSELYQTLVYGIKDVHYTLNSDGTAKTLGGSGNPTGDWAYGQVKWVMGNIMNSLVTQSDTVGTNDYTKSLENKAKINPLSGFSFDRSECEALYASLKAIWDEYYPMFSRGYLGADKFEAKYQEFQQKLEKAGIKTYIEKVQVQIDQYVAKNKCKW